MSLPGCSRTITDAAIMHSVLVGPSDKDPWSLSGPSQQPLSPKLAGRDLSGVRIGYIELTANPRIAADVRTNTRASPRGLGGDGRGGRGIRRG